MEFRQNEGEFLIDLSKEKIKKNNFNKFPINEEGVGIIFEMQELY